MVWLGWGGGVGVWLTNSVRFTPQVPRWVVFLGGWVVFWWLGVLFVFWGVGGR